MNTDNFRVRFFVYVLILAFFSLLSVTVLILVATLSIIVEVWYQFELLKINNKLK